MKEFEQSQIDSAKGFFESRGFPIETSQLDGLTVSYYVLPQDLNPVLPDFAFRMTTSGSQTGEVTGIFGVSDSIPQELRPFWAGHEIIEFIEIGISEKSRCVEAEDRIVGIVPPELKDDFLARRVDFFTGLVRYFQTELEKGSQDFTHDDLEEAQKALGYLQGIQKVG